ncbi:MAG: peptidoglycan DD-metalloendopeptidase family protein [Pseudomonadota bacterium]|nr:peptidoglycan DD-metalloendopeptidase family protein [Pseudomonadota bacterium]
MNPRRILIGVCLTLLLTWPLAAIALPRAAAVPGGIAVIPLTSDAAEPEPAEVRYDGRRVLTVRSDGRWFALVGIPLSATAGAHRVVVADDAGPRDVAFVVTEKQYAEQRLNVAPKMVDLDAETLARVRAETPRIRKALRHWSGTLLADQARLDSPVEGPFSSPFGLRRFFNDQPRKPHSGLDIAAPEGTPIHAPATARVIDAGDFYFNGNTVFLDHGRGLVTMYCHLQAIDVKPGDRLNAGERIGRVGQTGRVTGAHLHWAVALNGHLIDPMLFLNTQGDANTP